MAYVTPPPLRPGDTIGVMAPSSRVAASDLEASQKFLEAKGYNVFIHPQCHAVLNQSAGTSAEKAQAFHDLARSNDIAAVFFATGGNRAMHFADLIDFDLVRQHPKIYMGFSDNTILLNAITARAGLVTYHGPTFKRLVKNPQADFNLRLLAGQEQSIALDGTIVLKEGHASGILIGGNLSMIRSMVKKDFPDTRGAVLFLEDINEESSRIDRDFCFLRRSGLLNDIGGLVLGQFTNLLDTGVHPFGFTFEDIIDEHTKGLNIPIWANAPFGHDKDLYALPIGQKVKMADKTIFL